MNRFEYALSGVGLPAKLRQPDFRLCDKLRCDAVLFAKLAEFAFARHEASFGLQRANRKRTVRFEQLAGAGDDSTGGVQRREPACVCERVCNKDATE